MEFIKEFYRFLLVRKKYWLIPIFLALILVGVILFMGHGTVAAPFIYTVF
jgi:hypothetical protein